MKNYSQRLEEYWVRHVVFVRVPGEPFGPIVKDRVYCINDYCVEDYVE